MSETGELSIYREIVKFLAFRSNWSTRIAKLAIPLLWSGVLLLAVFQCNISLLVCFFVARVALPYQKWPIKALGDVFLG
ncbi:hypothetical protein Tco_0872845 [Tanacetum coccineum]